MIVALLAASPCHAQSQNLVTIGGVLPLTGDAGTFGLNAARGAQLAVAQANASKLFGDGVTIRWVVEDSRGAPTDAVSAARKLIDIDQAIALVGDVTSAATNAIVPIVTSRKVGLISPSASDPALTGVSPFFARVYPSDVYESAVTGKYAVERNLKRIAVVYAQTDYGVGMIKAFTAVVKSDRIGMNVPFPEGFSDFRAVIQRAAAANADAFFLVAFPETAQLFLRQLQEADSRLPVLGTATLEDERVAKSPYADRVIFASPVPPSDSDAIRRRFIDAYSAKFGEPPGALSDAGYDSANLLLQALAASSRDTAQAMAWVKAQKDYKGASGVMTFEATGDVIKPFRLKRVQAGQFVWVE
jgi:branched-chain amino acid transport system substrate-binding protein